MPTLLRDFFEQTYAPNRLRGKSKETFRLYRFTIEQFSRMLGRYPSLDDLTNENTLKHLLRRSSVAPATRNKERAQLFAMWRFAAQRGMVSGWPDVPAEDEPQRTPEAWTSDDIADLFAAIRLQTGTIGTTPKNLWWEALVRLALDTGERIGALRAAKWNWIERQWIRFPAEVRKGGKRDKQYQLSAITIEAMQRLRKFSNGDCVFEWPYCDNYLWPLWRQILTDAKLSTGRKCGLHRLRKTLASVAYAAGMDAQDLLDHSDRRTTQRYLDPRFTRQTQACRIISDWLKNPPKKDEGCDEKRA